MADSVISILVDSTGAVLGLNAAGRAFERFADQSNTAEGALSRLEARIGGSFSRAISSLTVALGGIATGDLIKNLIDVNMHFEQVRLSLMAGANNALTAGADFNWLRQQAVALGLPLSQIGPTFARMTAAAKGTQLQGQGMRDLFTSFSQLGVAFGRTPEQMQRAFLGISEMLNTAKINMREVRMVALQVPGGFQLMADAAGMSIGKFEDAIRKGTVNATQLLLKLPGEIQSKFGPAIEAALTQSPSLALGKMKAIIENLLYDVGQQGGFMTQFVGMIRDIGNALQSVQGTENVRQIAVAMGELMGIVRGGADFFIGHIREMAAVTAALGAGATVIGIKALVGAFTSLAGVAEGASVVGIMLNPWVALAAAIGVAVGLLFEFGGRMVTIGGQTSSVINLVRAGFEVAGQQISNLVAKVVGLAQELPIVGNLIGHINALLAEVGVGGTFKELGEELKGLVTGVSQSDAFSGLISAARVAMSAVGTIFSNGIQLIGVGWQLFTSMAAVAFQAIEPLITPVINAILNVVGLAGDAVSKLFDPKFDLSAWTALGRVVGSFWDVLTQIVSGVVGFVALVSSVVGTLITPFAEAFGGIFNVVTTVIDTIMDVLGNLFSFMTYNGQAAVKQQTHDWKTSADSIVGFILAIIQTAGLVIEVVGNISTAVIELGKIAGGTAMHLATAAAAGVTGNFKEAANQFGAALDTAVNSKLSVNLGKTAQDIAALPKQIQDSQHLVTNAMDTGDGAGKAMDTAKTRVGKLWDNTGQGLFGDKKAKAQQAGTDHASAYVDGVVKGIVAGGARITAAQAADAAKRKAAADELAKAQQDSYNQFAAQATTNPAAEDLTNKKKKKGPDDHAQEAIDKLLPSTSTYNKLTTMLEQQAGAGKLAANSLREYNAQVAAQQALDAAGYKNVTVGEAIGQGGVRANLVNAAYNNSMAKQASESTDAMAKQTIENQRASESYSALNAIMRNSDVTSNDYKANLAALQQLKEKDPSLNVGSATSFDQLRASLDPVSRLMFDSAVAMEKLSQAGKGIDAVSSALGAFRSQEADIAQFASSTDHSASGLHNLQAVMTAQQAVMSAYGDKVFDATRLQDAQTKGLYDTALAFARAGGSVDSYSKSLLAIHQTSLTNADPIAGKRNEIQQSGRDQSAALDAGYQLQRMSINANATSQLGTHPENADSIIATETASLTSAAAAYKKAQGELAGNIQFDLMNNSSSMVDGFKSAIIEMHNSIMNFSADAKNLFNQAFNGIADSLTKFITTGQNGFKQLALSVAQSVEEMIVKFLLLKAVETALNFAVPGLGTALGGAQGALFANGGIMTSGGSLPLNKYANGGVANSPQMAIFGEGRGPEAYVPLPDGRTIPVTMAGQTSSGMDPSAISAAVYAGVVSGSRQAAVQPPAYGSSSGSYFNATSASKNVPPQVTINQTTHVNAGGQGGAPSQSAGHAALADTISKRMSHELRGTIIGTVQNELRPGGAFNKMGSSSNSTNGSF